MGNWCLENSAPSVCHLPIIHFSVTFPVNGDGLRLSVKQDSSSSSRPCPKGSETGTQMLSNFISVFAANNDRKTEIKYPINGSPRIIKKSLKALRIVIPSHHLNVSGTQATAF